jgi:hypothetical protein
MFNFRDDSYRLPQNNGPLISLENKDQNMQKKKKFTYHVGKCKFNYESLE